MPTSFTATYKAKFNRTGPFLKTQPNVKRVEGNAQAAFTAIVQGLEMIPKIVYDHAEATVQEFTKAHSDQAQAESRSVLYQKPGRRSGLLDKSFSTSVEGDGKSIRGVSRNTARYAIFHELGFHHWRDDSYVEPKPFMFPVFGRMKDDFKSKIREIFG